MSMQICTYIFIVDKLSFCGISLVNIQVQIEIAFKKRQGLIRQVTSQHHVTLMKAEEHAETYQVTRHFQKLYLGYKYQRGNCEKRQNGLHSARFC